MAIGLAHHEKMDGRDVHFDRPRGKWQAGVMSKRERMLGEMSRLALCTLAAMVIACAPSAMDDAGFVAIDAGEDPTNDAGIDAGNNVGNDAGAETTTVDRRPTRASSLSKLSQASAAHRPSVSASSLSHAMIPTTFRL